MGTITAQALVDKAAQQLRDEGNSQWTESTLLGWLNDGQRQAVIFKDDANVKVETVQLVAGTKQSVPAKAHLLLDVPRNMGTDGTTVGPAITYVKRRDLDMERPGWHTDTAAAEVEHWTYDQRMPKVFWTYPPQPSSSQGYVELMHNEIPDDIVIGNIGDPITISDVYSMALIDYMLFRAYDRDNKSASYQQRSQRYWNRFLQSLGVTEQRENVSDPSVQKLQKVSEP